MTRQQFRDLRSKNVFQKSFERITREQQDLIDESYEKLYALNNRNKKRR
jgi:hypothetical protein